MRDTHCVDGWLDPVTGASLKTAIDSLAKPLGQFDMRTAAQRRADAVGELVHHAMEQGTMPRRNGVRPHISIHTTIANLKGEVGVSVSQLEDGMPSPPRNHGAGTPAGLQRLSCDASLHRILKADSVVTDVGRATRSVSPAQWRALKARYKTCAWPGCDRPINWTNPHHIVFWSRGGNSNLPNLVPLCHHHHRLVHEGGWQVIRTSDGIKFIPPDHVMNAIKRRWGESAA